MISAVPSSSSAASASPCAASPAASVSPIRVVDAATLTPADFIRQFVDASQPCLLENALDAWFAAPAEEEKASESAAGAVSGPARREWSVPALQPLIGSETMRNVFVAEAAHRRRFKYFKSGATAATTPAAAADASAASAAAPAVSSAPTDSTAESGLTRCSLTFDEFVVKSAQAKQRTEEGATDQQAFYLYGEPMPAKLAPLFPTPPILSAVTSPLTSTLLWVSLSSTCSPLHFDLNEGLLMQLHGSKRVTLASPDAYDALHPHSIHSPHDRQSRVDDIHSPGASFESARAVPLLSGDLSAGRLLFIPYGWWHQLEADDSSISISMRWNPYENELRAAATTFSATAAMPPALAVIGPGFFVVPCPDSFTPPQLHALFRTKLWSEPSFMGGQPSASWNKTPEDTVLANLFARKIQPLQPQDSLQFVMKGGDSLLLHVPAFHPLSRVRVYVLFELPGGAQVGICLSVNLLHTVATFTAELRAQLAIPSLNDAACILTHVSFGSSTVLQGHILMLHVRKGWLHAAFSRPLIYREIQELTKKTDRAFQRGDRELCETLPLTQPRTWTLPVAPLPPQLQHACEWSPRVTLPTRLLLRIVSGLTWRERMAASSVSRLLRAAARCKSLWTVDHVRQWYAYHAQHPDLNQFPLYRGKDGCSITLQPPMPTLADMKLRQASAITNSDWKASSYSLLYFTGDRHQLQSAVNIFP